MPKNISKQFIVLRYLFALPSSSFSLSNLPLIRPIRSGLLVFPFNQLSNQKRKALLILLSQFKSHTLISIKLSNYLFDSMSIRVYIIVSQQNSLLITNRRLSIDSDIFYSTLRYFLLCTVTLLCYYTYLHNINNKSFQCFIFSLI